MGLLLTDELIEGAIDSITGFIVATVSEKTGNSVQAVMSDFLGSNTYRLLADKNTGLYWDSIPQLLATYEAEAGL